MDDQHETIEELLRAVTMLAAEKILGPRAEDLRVTASRAGQHMGIHARLSNGEHVIESGCSIDTSRFRKSWVVDSTMHMVRGAIREILDEVSVVGDLVESNGDLEGAHWWRLADPRYRAATEAVGHPRGGTVQLTIPISVAASLSVMFERSDSVPPDLRAYAPALRHAVAQS
jgi:hypothetical protein